MNGIAPSANAQYNGVPLDPPPSVRQGFGRANLGYSLPLAGSGLGWNLQVALPVVMHGLPALTGAPFSLALTGGRRCHNALVSDIPA